MRQLLRSLLIPFALLLTGLFLSHKVSQVKMDEALDMVTINRIARTVEQNWDKLEGTELSEFNFSSYEFSVLDNDGQLLFCTSEKAPVSIHKAVEERQTILDIAPVNQIKGKVLIVTSLEDREVKFSKKLSQIILAAFILSAAYIALHSLYLNIRVLSPFRKLQSFAKDISQGKFDTPLEMDRKNIFGAFTESFDIMREELRAAQRKEMAANESKKELIASLSHDIKTPVTSIKLISELLLVTLQDEAAKNKLNTIYSKAESIDHLITNMYHSVLKEITEIEVSLTDQESSVLTDIIKHTDYHNKILMDAIPQCMIRIDLLRMEQVINNIINNSYKYADTPIHISFSFVDEFLQLDIEDYGKGIKESEIEHVFQKFYRGTNSDEYKKEGDGLGLFITKDLMEKMGGGIECINRGDGLTVRLYLRLSE